jgi:hypothetical protein
VASYPIAALSNQDADSCLVSFDSLDGVSHVLEGLDVFDGRVTAVVVIPFPGDVRRCSFKPDCGLLSYADEPKALFPVGPIFSASAVDGDDLEREGPPPFMGGVFEGAGPRPDPSLSAAVAAGASALTTALWGARSGSVS